MPNTSLMQKYSPLIVIVGETASGKTALGIKLAKRFDGEVICADSRTIYKHMDIGTAKPTKEERAAAKHHLLDIIEPNETYSAARFQKDANRLIKDIHARGKLPIIVGGTGLYVDSVLFNYQFSNTDAKRDPGNPRHLDKNSVSRRDTEMRKNTLLIGLKRDREELRQRVEQRVEKMLDQGLIEEVKWLGEKYGFDHEALSGIGYRYFAQYLRGEISVEEAKQKFIQGHLSLAKRQRTWFKRNKSIHWVNNSGDAVDLATTFLSKFIA